MYVINAKILISSQNHTQYFEITAKNSHTVKSIMLSPAFFYVSKTGLNAMLS